MRLNNELQTTPLLCVLTYFLGYESSLLLSLYVFLLTSKIFKESQKINEVGFLIEVPTTFSSIEKLAKKWQMAHTERHPPEEMAGTPDSTIVSKDMVRFRQGC